MLNDRHFQLTSGVEKSHLLEPHCQFFSPKPRASSRNRRSLNVNEQSQEFLNPEPTFPPIGCRVTPFFCFLYYALYIFYDIRYINIKLLHREWFWLDREWFWLIYQLLSSANLKNHTSVCPIYCLKRVLNFILPLTRHQNAKFVTWRGEMWSSMINEMYFFRGCVCIKAFSGMYLSRVFSESAPIILMISDTF